MPEQIHEIPLAEIGVSEQNVRETDAEKGVEELAESIRRLGLLQPVVLKGEPGSSPYELVIGQRRLLAHRKLRKETIAARFIDPADDFGALAASLAENLNRVEVNHADASKAVTELYKHYGENIEELMAATGLSKPMISKYLYIEARASARMLELLRQDAIKKDDIKRALRAAGDNVQKAERLLDLWAEAQLTRHEKVRATEYGQAHTEAPPEEIVRESKQPRVVTALMVPLRTSSVREGLEKAVGALDLSKEEVAAQALEEWLSDKGFIGGE